MRGRRIILMLIITWRSTWRSFHCGWWEMLNVPLHKAWMVLISVCQKDTWFMSERRLFLEGFCVSGTMEQDLHNNTQKKFPKSRFSQSVMKYCQYSTQNSAEAFHVESYNSFQQMCEICPLLTRVVTHFMNKLAFLQCFMNCCNVLSWFLLKWTIFPPFFKK